MKNNTKIYNRFKGFKVFIPLPLVFNLGAFGYAPERRVQWLILKREMS